MNLKENNDQMKNMKKMILLIDEAMTVSCDPKKLIDNILKKITEDRQWVVAGFWKIGIKNDDLSLLSFHCLEPERFDDFLNIMKLAHFKSGKGLPGSVHAIKFPVWIADIAEENNFPRKPLALKNGVRGGMAFPVIVNEIIVGVIEFFSENTIEAISILDPEFLGLGRRIGSALNKYNEKN